MMNGWDKGFVSYNIPVQSAYPIGMVVSWVYSVLVNTKPGQRTAIIFVMYGCENKLVSAYKLSMDFNSSVVLSTGSIKFCRIPIAK